MYKNLERIMKEYLMITKYQKMYLFIKEFLKEKDIDIIRICKLPNRNNLLLYEYRYTICMCLYNELNITGKFISDILGISEDTVCTTLNAFPIDIAINKHKKLYNDLINKLIKEVNNAK